MARRPGLEARSRRKKDTSKADKSAAFPVGEPAVSGAFHEIASTERTTLLRWARRRTSPHRLVVRSRIVLLAAEGLATAAIAATLQVSPATVRLWKQRFALGGPAALTAEAPGRGRRSGTSVTVTVAVLEATRGLAINQTSVRRVAARAGTSPSTVWRVWRRYGLGSGSSSDFIERALRKVIPETPVNGR